MQVTAALRGFAGDKSSQQPPGARPSPGLAERHESGEVRWGRGDGGLEWKERELTDRRDRAMEFLFDVSKRRPIHDSLRAQAALNERRLRMPSEGTETVTDATATAVLMDSIQSIMEREEMEAERLSDDDVRAARASNALLHDTVQELLDIGDEGAAGDSLAHLSAEDVHMLAEELFGDASASAEERRAKLLREWFKLRRGGQAGYGALQREEQTMWNPFYLKHLGPKG